MKAARIDLSRRAEGGRSVTLSGRWTLAVIAREHSFLEKQLTDSATDAGVAWDCTGIEALDSAGAMLLWRAWGSRLPEVLLARPEQMRVWERIGTSESAGKVAEVPHSPLEWMMRIGEVGMGFYHHLADFVALLGNMLQCLLHLLRFPSEMPRREFSANLYKSGVQAMPVAALVSFLIGLVLAHLSAMQLKQFGADVFIINILGMGIIRELGPVLVAILVAGRSGSAMTAQLGVMRVTEEIDALATMGVSRSLRLIFPKVAALAVAMPLLVLWTIVIAMIGGMLAAKFEVDIGYMFFIRELPKAVPVANLWIGLSKGIVFGISVALVSCHFGLRVRPNTESLSANTTAAVVSAITVVILLDAVFALFTGNIGMPI